MTASSISELADIGSTFWILALMAVLIGTGCGFGTGIYYARWSDKRTFQRARAGVTQLYQTIISTIDTAQEVCSLLEMCPGNFLKPAQTETLITKRNGLLESVTRLVKRHRPEFDETPKEKAGKKSAPAPKPLELQWITNPTDEMTGLPGRKIFDENLALLMGAGQESNRESGLLFLKIDKFDSLRKRAGTADAEKLVKKLASVVCRSVRDKDLVCRYSPEMLAVLLPDIDTQTGETLATVIRDSVRAYHFRVEEHGPEIFVTASFGYSTCRPHDNPELVVNRGADALSKSQQRGRNQLHAHNGQSLKHCIAG